MRKLFYALAAVVTLTACNSKDYTITVTYDNADDFNGKQLVLINYDGGDTIATATVEQGKATFTGEMDGSMVARVLYPGGRQTFILEPAKINIQVTDTATNVTGSALTQKMRQSDAEEVSAEAILENYKANKDNAFGWWSLYQYLIGGNFTTAEIQAILDEAPEAYRSSKRMTNLLKAAKNADATAVGKPYADFSVRSPQGMMVNLSDYLNPAAFTIVDFWASWCGPCRKETKVLKEILAKHEGRVEVLGVACWDKPEDTQAAIEQLQLPWPQIINAQYIASDLYGFNSIPHIMVIAPDGTIVSRGLTGDALKAKIDELVK